MSLFSGYETQEYISDRMPMPVDVVSDTAYVNSISSETVQLYYFNSGVLTIDAGQAAGVLVVAKLSYTGILDALGSGIGNDKDTSLVWTTGTVLPIANIKPFTKINVTDPSNATLEQIALDVTANFATGEWCIDHRNGLIIGKKATTGVSDTAAYKVQSQATGGGTSIASTVKISDGTDILDVLVQDAAFGTASKGLAVFGKYQATPTTYTDGDAVPILLDANGRLVLSSDIQLGAVELKNGADDTRATITAANTARTTATTVLATQPIDAAGNVLGRDAANTARTTATLVNPVQLVGADGTVNPSGSLNTNAPFAKLTDGTSNLTLGTGTVKTIPSEIHDGTTGVDVIATVNSLKTDLSSYGGTAVGVGNAIHVQPGTAAVFNTSEAVATTITSGNKTVTTSATAEALGASLATKSIYIRAKAGNTGNVFIGDSTVDAVTNQGIILAANDSVTLEIANRATVYVDVAVNGEGVDYVALS